MNCISFSLPGRTRAFFVALLTGFFIFHVTPSFAQYEDLEADLATLEKELGKELGESVDLEIDLEAADFETSPFLKQVQSRPKDMSTETITLELKGVDVLDVLKILSKKSGLNIVAGKNVRGQVTLFLQDVDVWLALLTVLETSELAYVAEEGIIKVMTLKDYETVYGSQFNDRRITRTYLLRYAKAVDVSTALSQLKSHLGTVIVDERSNSVIATDVPSALASIEKTIQVVDKPNETRFFQLRYADVEDIEAKLTEIVTPGTGVLKIDTRTNKIVITDLPEKVQQMGEIIRAFDTQPQQVLIEAKIVQVALNDDFAFGIDWQMVLTGRPQEDIFNFNTRAFGGMISTTDDPATSPISSLTNSSDPGLTTFTINTANDDFNAIIAALEGISKVNILANPRINVLDKQEAKISVATKQPFVSQTVVQATNTSTTADNVDFVDVGVTLSVTPTITDTGYVLMQIKPQISTQGEPLELQGAGQSATSSEALFTRTIVPVVTSQEAETTVLIKSGQTVILGGLIREREAETQRRFPFLANIPLFGVVFKNETRDFTRDELAIFITPTITSPDLTATGLERFVNDYGLPRDLNEAAGAIHEKGFFHSQEPFSLNQKPYWKLTGKESRQFLRSKDLYRKPFDPYADRSQVGIPAGRSTLPDTMNLEGYRQVIKEKIRSVVRRHSELASVGDINVILTIRSDGAVEEISFSNRNIQGDQSLQRKFVDVVQSAGPFPRFPSSMNRPRESFTLLV